MSSVTFSTPVSHHFDSRRRMCSVWSRSPPRGVPEDPLLAALSRSFSRLGELGVRVLPHLVQEAVAPQHRRVAPVQRSLGTGGVQDRQSHRVGAVSLHQFVGIHHVAQVLAHLAPAADDHLVKEAARERLAVGEEVQRPDIAQRLGDRALVEDEVAAVRARHEPLGGKPVAQVLQSEDLLEGALALARGHACRHPEPQRVEVAVQRVGLPARGPAADRAARVDELIHLCEGVAGARGPDVQRQQHRQLITGHRNGAALLAVDDGNRRAPGALARDREVKGAVAHGGPRALDGAGRGRIVIRRLLVCEPQPACEHLVGSVLGGRAQDGGDAETRVDHRRMYTGSASPAGPGIVRPVSITGTVSASRELRSQPPVRSVSSCARTSGSPAQWSASGWRGESRTNRAPAADPEWGVKTVSRSPVSACRSISTPSSRPSTIS